MSDKTLKVLLHGNLVGFIEKRADMSIFTLAESYLSQPNRPVLGRWFEDYLSVSVQHKGIHSNLPPFFQNYLPPQHSALRKLIAARANVPEHKEFELITVLGEDLPGAAVIVPADDNPSDQDPPVSPRLPSSDTDPLKFSLAGLQLKFSMIREGHGFTFPMSGNGGHWIVKLPYKDTPRVPHNEYAMLRWAQASGIEVPECELVDVTQLSGLPSEVQFSEDKALVLKRFDRTDHGERIHQEDFAQVLNIAAEPPRLKYEGNYATVANIVSKVCGDADLEQFITRLVFTILSGNHDAHLKNWSLLYKNPQRAELAPAYDLVCTAMYRDKTDDKLALSLSKERDPKQIKAHHFETLAKKIGQDPARISTWVNNASQTIRDRWKTNAGDFTEDKQLRTVVDQHLASCSI